MESAKSVPVLALAGVSDGYSGPLCSFLHALWRIDCDEGIYLYLPPHTSHKLLPLHIESHYIISEGVGIALVMKASLQYRLVCSDLLLSPVL